MRDGIKAVAVVLGALFTFGVLAFIGTGMGWVNLTFWAPKYEQTRRKVFDESRTFQSGTVKEIRRLQGEYLKAQADGNNQLMSTYRSLIVAEADRYEQTGSYLPSDLDQFVRSLK